MLPELQIHNLLEKKTKYVKILSLGIICYVARDNWNKGYERVATTTQEGCRRVIKGELFFISSQEVARNSVIRLRIEWSFTTMKQESHAQREELGVRKTAAK